jgi:hypothetical protein
MQYPVIKMAPPKKAKQKRKYQTPVYNEICYVSDPKALPDRCSNDRRHFFIHAWLGYEDYTEQYYKYVYKKNNKLITSLGSAESFEDALRKFNTALLQDKSKGGKIGDLIILTHATWYYAESKNETDTVKMQLPLFSMRNPDNSQRSLPIWWSEKSDGLSSVSEETGSEDINKLQQPNSDYYKFVDGKDPKEGLLSVVVSNINNYLDESSHIWLVGCNLGLDADLLKAIRKLFSNKPTIYAFNKFHSIYYYYSEDVSKPYSCYEEVGKKEGKGEIRLWTSEGMKAIVHEP